MRRPKDITAAGIKSDTQTPPLWKDRGEGPLFQGSVRISLNCRTEFPDREIQEVKDRSTSPTASFLVVCLKIGTSRRREASTIPCSWKSGETGPGREEVFQEAVQNASPSRIRVWIPFLFFLLLLLGSSGVIFSSHCCLPSTIPAPPGDEVPMRSGGFFRQEPLPGQGSEGQNSMTSPAGSCCSPDQAEEQTLSRVGPGERFAPLEMDGNLGFWKVSRRRGA